MNGRGANDSSSAAARPFVCRLAPIRLGEFDLGGVLYHGRYFNLLEEGREAFLRSIGLPYYELVRAGCHLAVTESRQVFQSPIRYGDELELELSFSEVRRTAFQADYCLFNLAAPDKPVHRAQTKHVFIRLKEGGDFKVEALPEKLLEGLKAYTV